jgi:hypothetical protein
MRSKTLNTTHNMIGAKSKILSLRESGMFRVLEEDSETKGMHILCLPSPVF